MMQSLPFPADPAQQIFVSTEDLKAMLGKMLAKKSLFQFDANIVMERMLEADLRGLPAYGVARIVDLLAAIDAGDVDPRGRVLTIAETPALAVLDGSRAAGAVAATKAIDIAIAKARQVGVGTVTVANSQPLGAASVYALLAAQAGMIGCCITSTGKASVSSPEGMTAVVGNTAISWAIPTGQDTPTFVFDSTCGAASWGQLAWLQKYGVPLPQHVFAGDSSSAGDLSQAILQPAGGTLGFGLSLVSSILAGPLSGGKMPLHKKRTSTADDSQHFFQAIDLAQFADPVRFYKEVNSTLQEIRALDSTVDANILRQEGHSTPQDPLLIPLHQSDAAALRSLAEKMKIPAPF